MCMWWQWWSFETKSKRQKPLRMKLVIIDLFVFYKDRTHIPYYNIVNITLAQPCKTSNSFCGYSQCFQLFDFRMFLYYLLKAHTLAVESKYLFSLSLRQLLPYFCLHGSAHSGHIILHSST